MGALMLPRPTPKTAYAAASTRSGVSFVSCVSTSAATAMATPATTRASRACPAPTSRPESGEQTTSDSAIGSVMSPAVDARRPRASCR